ncbi:hypothetical protein RMATCC62417_05812 [Rhizopus microsporus]|nr:hypothetical protein RMATCC62417_05812 [Rhizopus microsporus]
MIKIASDKENVRPMHYGSSAKLLEKHCISSNYINKRKRKSVSLECNDHRKRKSKQIQEPSIESRNSKDDCSNPPAVYSQGNKEQYDDENIQLISQRLKDNMIRVTYNLMEALIQSNKPHDLFIYDKVFNPHQQLISMKSKQEASYNKTSVQIESMATLPIITATACNSNDDQNCNSSSCSNDSSVSNCSNNDNHANTTAILKEEKKVKCDEVPLLQIGSGMLTKNLSFGIEQENDFITNWLQHHTCADIRGTVFNHYHQDSFSIITDQELSDLLGADESFYSFSI